MTAKAHLRRKILRAQRTAAFALLAGLGLAMLGFMLWVFQITLRLPH